MIGRGDQHQSIHDYRRHFEAVRIIRVENPLRAKLIRIVYVDFCEAAVTASGVVAIVGRPIGGRRLCDKMLWKNVDGSGNRGIEFLIGKCQCDPATAKRDQRRGSEAKMHVEPDQLANCTFTHLACGMLVAEDCVPLGRCFGGKT